MEGNSFYDIHKPLPFTHLARLKNGNAMLPVPGALFCDVFLILVPIYLRA